MVKYESIQLSQTYINDGIMSTMPPCHLNKKHTEDQQNKSKTISKNRTYAQINIQYISAELIPCCTAFNFEGKKWQTDPELHR